MDAFHSYDNTAGFFIGNEVIAMANQSLAAPYIKAAARDLKAYRNSKGYRDIAVGYSTANIAQLQPMLQDYLACGSNSSEAIDMFGLNTYQWCGDSNIQASGYDTLNTYAENYSIPIFFSETGCNVVQPRTFEDQSAIFGSAMNGIWSGAIIYEWIEETNNYGLISYGPEVSATVVASNVVAGISRQGTPSPVRPDYTNLQSQWATLTPTGFASSAYSPTLTPPACPSSTAGGWLVDGDIALPSIIQTLSTSSASQTSSTAGPTPTSPNDASPASSSGLFTGAKAGIAIGIVVFFIAIVLIFFYFRKRGKAARVLSEENANRHELVTDANRHEMITKHNIPEMSEQNSGKLTPRVSTGPAYELDPTSRITSLNSDDMLPSPQELHSSTIQAQHLLSPPATTAHYVSETTIPSSKAPANASVEEQGVAATTSNEEEEQKLKVLRERIERVRAEKARLKRVQELEDIQAQTKREIMEVQRRVGGSGG
jgi:hypothetical protein